MLLISKQKIAEIAYGVDVAIVGSGATWQDDVSGHDTWFGYVTDYIQKGIAPSIGSSTRNAAFLAVMAVCKPGIEPGHVQGVVASITIEASRTIAHTASAVTLTATCKDFAGNTISPNPTLAWVSSDPTKATIGASTGLLTPVAAGSTTVTASVVARGVQPAVTSNNDAVTVS